MANLLANITGTSADTAPASWANIGDGESDEFEAVVSVVGSGSIIILMMSMSPTLNATDASADVRFTDGGTPVGPVIAVPGVDSTNEGTGGTIMHMLTGLTGSHTFACQWQDRTGTPDTDTGRTRSFQVIEVTSGDGSLIVDESSTASHTISTYADIGGLVPSAQTVASGDILLFVANIPITGGSSRSADFRFATAGTREGPELTASGWQATDVGGESCITWLATGKSGSLVFSIQGANRTGTTTCDTGRTRTFQVLKLTRGTILLNLTATGQNNAPASYADVPGLAGTSGSAVVSDSVVLFIGNVQIELTGTDETADFRFDQGDTREGPEVTLGFGDATNLWHGASLAWAKTGVTGTPTFGMQWVQRAATAVTDATRTRSFQVLELLSSTIEQEGFQFRDDDDNEADATNLGAQDENLTRARELNTRLRMLLNATGDPASEQLRCDYRRLEDADAEYRAVPPIVFVPYAQLVQDQTIRVQWAAVLEPQQHRPTVPIS